MADTDKLNEREDLILQAVVHTFVTTAEAVGSRSIVRRFDLELSPATVRNVMADLEEAGYLQQLHASSGRVPTDRGYRYFVDHLMRVQELTISERARIEHELSQRLNDMDDVMRQTCHMLALVSHQTGIVEPPAESDLRVRRIELMPVSECRVAVLVADNYGRLRTMFVELDELLDGEQLHKLSRFLNEHLAGEPVDRLEPRLQEQLRTLLDEERRMAERALRLFQLLPSGRPSQLFLEGATQLFEQPEFRDVSKAQEVFSLLEEQDRLAELLRAGMDDAEPKTSVVIGSEALGRGLEGISIVTSPYRVDDRPVGMIGVLGPRRMPYSRLTAIVDYTAGALSRFLTRLAR
ncbi:MAG: heat-inducible transcription repressor HrcA [bacterium]|nr:heat-inducible transcription repressor HrcA [bacterium]